GSGCPTAEGGSPRLLAIHLEFGDTPGRLVVAVQGEVSGFDAVVAVQYDPEEAGVGVIVLDGHRACPRNQQVDGLAQRLRFAACHLGSSGEIVAVDLADEGLRHTFGWAWEARRGLGCTPGWCGDLGRALRRCRDLGCLRCAVADRARVAL